MKPLIMEGDLDAKNCEGNINISRMQALFKRHAERKKFERNGLLSGNLGEVEKFKETFFTKQTKIENELELLLEANPGNELNATNHINGINSEIQELQKLYSDATHFLRIYDRKVFQECLQRLQIKMQNLESKLKPKKKFGFKVKKNNSEENGLKFKEFEVEPKTEMSTHSIPANFVGIGGKSNADITLEGKEIENRDIVLKDLANCCIRLKGVPTTVHATNIDSCTLFFGPVVTSVFIENMKNSVLHLACQQLRIHETTNSDFYVHITSKSVIENCNNLRFGVYKLDYEGLEEDYKISGLNKKINNWAEVDDFNWLVKNKPSPNWSKITLN